MPDRTLGGAGGNSVGTTKANLVHINNVADARVRSAVAHRARDVLVIPRIGFRAGLGYVR